MPGRVLWSPLFESTLRLDLGPADSRRTEQSFLSHTYRWLKPGGVLIFVIPGERLADVVRFSPRTSAMSGFTGWSHPSVCAISRWW